MNKKEKQKLSGNIKKEKSSKEETIPNIYNEWNKFKEGKTNLETARPDIFLKFQFPDYFKDFIVDDSIVWTMAISIPFHNKLKEYLGDHIEVKHFTGKSLLFTDYVYEIEKTINL